MWSRADTMSYNGKLFWIILQRLASSCLMLSHLFLHSIKNCVEIICFVGVLRFFNTLTVSFQGSEISHQKHVASSFHWNRKRHQYHETNYKFEYHKCTFGAWPKFADLIKVWMCWIDWSLNVQGWGCDEAKQWAERWLIHFHSHFFYI